MLIIPVWLKRGQDDKRSEFEKAERAQNAGTSPQTAPTNNATSTNPDPANAAVSPPPASTEPRPIGHGLTFAIAPLGGGDAVPDAANLTHLSCHGEPKQLDQPHRDSCNPYKGDTSCRVVLPVLCFQGKGQAQPAGLEAGQYIGWSGGTLAATQAVMGAILTSEAAASARCEKELGVGWRMAEFHDAGGWGMQGQRGLGLAANTRFWVHINDQPGNCWDSKP